MKENKIKFDFVCSFGFVEHFDNFDEVIINHAQLLNSGGELLITTPNFKGWMQYLPHLIFDYANLKKHNLKSMSPNKWKEILEKNNFEVKYYGFFGGYEFWVDFDAPRSFLSRICLNITQRIIHQFQKAFNFLKLESSWFSCYCGIIAIKN